MAISTSDISLRQSVVAGSAGGAISGSSVASGVDNNIWPDITSSERIAGGERFRKVFVQNGNATDAALKPVVYLPYLPLNAQAQIGLGVDSADDATAAQGNMTAFTGNAPVALISDGADTRNATIWGLNNAGTPVPTIETIPLTGATEVVGATIWSKVWAVSLSAISASRIVTVKQGSVGSTRGTIGINMKGCWFWITSPDTKAAGLAMPDLVAGGSIGVWMRLSWAAAAPVTRPSGMTLAVEENA